MIFLILCIPHCALLSPPVLNPFDISQNFQRKVEDDDSNGFSDQFMNPIARHKLIPILFLLSQYARYFGGDLKLISMEGYGTDVYIHLNRLSSSREPLQ